MCFRVTSAVRPDPDTPHLLFGEGGGGIHHGSLAHLALQTPHRPESCVIKCIHGASGSIALLAVFICRYGDNKNKDR